LGIAHGTASRPGAVTLVPDLGLGRYLVFAGAMLWLALWRGPVRLWALIPAVLAALSLAWLRPPDLLITGEGRNLGVVSENGQDLLIFREGRSSFTRDAMLEAAGIAGRVAPLDSWPGAHCNHDYCLVELSRGGRLWRILIARTKARVPGDQLASACAGVDIVIAQQKLFGPCHPALIRADRSLLMRTGGLALDLVNRTVSTVEAGQGDHPWWRAPHRMPTDYDNEFIDPVSGEAASYAEGPIRITPDPTAVAGFH
jgi:competence protein ComEC